MGQLFKNNFESTLAVAIASTDVVPMNVQVAAGDGDGAPLIATVGADYFDVTLENAAGQIEIFRIKQRTSGSDVLVVDSRAREGTTAQNWTTSPATVVGLRVTAAAIEAVLAHAIDTTDAHAASAITNTPAGNLAATTVQAALDELQTDIDTRAVAATVATDISTAITDHEAAADPHPTYTTAAELATYAQPLDTTLTALASALSAANKIPYATALNTLGELDFKDEDNMVSNSATALPSQQSVKAYVDAEIAGISLLTLGTPVASTSGTSIDFTSIPAGTKRIVVMFNAVSTNGTANPLIQLGDAGGVEATGYGAVSGYITNGGASGVATYTTGFGLYGAQALNAIYGSYIFSLLDSATNTWVGQSVVYLAGIPMMSSGAKALSAELDRVRITTANGTDAFDAGSINILYE